jgi:endogenous inhibitor of DNA gyrase (YacG/DUF329 family)
MNPKPCPFCGTPSRVFWLSKNRVRIYCAAKTCEIEVRTIFYETLDEAMDAWNTRGGKTCSQK